MVARGGIDGAARSPITGRDVGAAYAQFELVASRRELYLAAGRGQADRARALDGKMHRRGERRGLGRAPRGDERHLAAERAQRDRFEPLPRALRQRGRCIEEKLQSTEETIAQRSIGL